MKQILSQGGHFVMMVKKNQPQSYDEIAKYSGEMAEDHKKMKKDRQEYRWYSVCGECSLLTKTQKEWPFVKTVGLARQIRIPVERDPEGNDITPDVRTFLEKGSRRRPRPVQNKESPKDIQKTGMISDMELTAAEMGV